VVALAPAGGWTQGDDSFHQTLDYFKEMQHLLRTLAPHAEQIVSTPAGRRRATLMTTSNFEHIPAELLAHQMCGVVACQAIDTFIEIARRDGWNLDPERIECPVRVVWGTADKVLAWPSSAARYRSEWAAQADWVVLDDVGHCPQLDVPLETAQLILDFTASRARAASGGAMPDGQHAANPRSRSE
jgi:pimeloyl-ACP methyl ester carboxylesterase